MAKIFKTPFAEYGDKISPPDAVQADGSVSYSLGYGFDYQRDTGLNEGGDPIDPLAKVFPREQHNGILNDITEAIGEIQQAGLPAWQEEGAPYPVNALVRYSDRNWRSLVANNTATPVEGISWTDWSGKFVGLGPGLPIQLRQVGSSIYAVLGTTDLGNLWTSTNFDPDTKIRGDFCSVAGFSGGAKTAPYFRHTPSSDSVLLAPLSSPVFVGSPQAPNQTPGSSNANLANTAFVTAAIAALFPKLSFSGNDFVRIPERTGGLIIQWGSVPYPDLVPEVEVAVTFPVQFPTAAFVAIGMAATAQSSVNVTSKNNLTRNGISFVAREEEVGTYAGSIFWIAVGY